MTSKFREMVSFTNIFDVALFFLSNVVTGECFMSISTLVLEMQQWVDQKSGGSGKLRIPNWTQMYLMKCN